MKDDSYLILCCVMGIWLGTSCYFAV